MAELCLESVASPIGDLLVATAGEAVCAIAFEGGEGATQKHLARHHGEAVPISRPVPARVRAARRQGPTPGHQECLRTTT